MDMPPVHMCAFLNDENQRLKEKIHHLKTRIHQLEQQTPRSTYSCTISCQTDLNLPSNQTSKNEIQHLHRLLKSQNDLLKKYENENSSESMPSKDLIRTYELRLKQSEKEREQAEQRANVAEQRMNTFRERYERMKREINSLDENFFEEIEDLKFALQQANKLNEEYEKTVKILSDRLGISAPKKA